MSTTPTQRAAKAADNAQAIARDNAFDAKVEAHADQAAAHVGAAANAPSPESREAHAAAAEAHEVAAQDQAAYLNQGDPDGAPGLTALMSAWAWMLTGIAEQQSQKDGGYND